MTVPMDRDEAQLIQAASSQGMDLSREQAAQLLQYRKLLQLWGARINLTAIKDPERILTHHFLDSLLLLKELPPGPLSLVDVGTGAGFPGAVCALMRPDWRVTLVERVQKKVAFLMALRRELRLSYQVLAQDVAALHEVYDVAVSRAAFPPQEWLRVGSRLVAPSGVLVAMVGGREPAMEAPAGFVPRGQVTYVLGGDHHEIRTWSRGP